MKKITKNSLIISVLTGLITLGLQYGIMYLPFGRAWLENPSRNLFFPIWSTIYMIGAFVAAKKYQLVKSEFVSSKPNDAAELAKQQQKWKAYKIKKAGDYLFIVFKVCAIAFPFYILAFVDNSKLLRSNVTVIIFFFVLGVVSFILSRRIKKHYEED